MLEASAGCLRSRSSSPAVCWTDIRPRRSWICSRASPRRSWTRSRTTQRCSKDTAIFITFDEGGGYYDSGYVSPIDFFGDGTRIPMIAVSPYATNGYLSHNYADHVSILKFVERNWDLEPITKRSRDNLPNPIADRSLPWVPKNSPALDDISICSTSTAAARAADWEHRQRRRLSGAPLSDLKTRRRSASTRRDAA